MLSDRPAAASTRTRPHIGIHEAPVIGGQRDAGAFRREIVIHDVTHGPVPWMISRGMGPRRHQSQIGIEVIEFLRRNQRECGATIETNNVRGSSLSFRVRSSLRRFLRCCGHILYRRFHQALFSATSDAPLGSGSRMQPRTSPTPLTTCIF